MLNSIQVEIGPAKQTPFPVHLFIITFTNPIPNSKQPITNNKSMEVETLIPPFPQTKPKKKK